MEEEKLYTISGSYKNLYLPHKDWYLRETRPEDLMEAKMLYAEGDCAHRVVWLDIVNGKKVKELSRVTDSTAYYCHTCRKFLAVTTDRRPLTAFKLCKQRKDGTLGPLFINSRQVIPVGGWLEAEDHPTKGYAHRPGWHCTFRPVAPHIAKEPKSGEKRVWCEVEVENWRPYDRPESQGGAWVLASRMKVLNILS